MEVDNESVSEYRVRRVWTDRVLGRDALPVVPVGPEEHASCERDSSGEIGPPSSRDPLIKPLALPANIFIPEIGMRADEFAHHANAFCIV